MCLKKSRKAHARKGKFKCRDCGAMSDVRGKLCKPKRRKKKNKKKSGGDKLDAILPVLLLAAVLSAACSVTHVLPELDPAHIDGELRSELAQGWKVRGPRIGVHPGQLGVFMDYHIAREGRSACLVSVDAVKADWGTIMQEVSGVPYRNQRVRFSAWVRTNRVSGWAGLWMGVDTEGRQEIAYDNMDNRPIRGSTEWTPYSVVLDIDENAAVINFGLVLHGKGQVWMDDCALEVVDDSVPVTDFFPTGYERVLKMPQRLFDSPVNMNFDEEFLE